MKELGIIDKDHLHLRIVHEISDLINQSTGLNTILEKVVNKIGDSLNFDVVSIYLWNKSKKRLELISTRGLKVEPGHFISLKPKEGLTGLVFSTMRTLNVMPASEHPSYKYFSEIGEEEFESYLGVPIILHNKCAGVLVAQTKEKKLINPAEETLFQIISSRLAGLMEVADTLERLKTPSIVKHETRTYQGKGVSSGLAIGDALIFRGLFQQIQADKIKSRSKSVEKKRLVKAISNVEKELHELIHNLDKHNILDKSEIDIFEAHLMIVNSVSLKDSLLNVLKNEGISAELAVVEGIESIANQFEHLSDRYLREKAQDFRDIGERLLHNLVNEDGEDSNIKSNGDVNQIVLAEDIGPSFVSMLNKNTISAIVTEKGGETSHAVIIAKSLGIPVIIGIEHICDLVRSGERIIVDGRTGFIFVNPDESLIEEYENTEKKIAKIRSTVLKKQKEIQKSEIDISITANVGFPLDLVMAKQNKIKDVGLFRTEFAFTQFEKWPGVREQVQIYKNMAKNFKGFITIRTLDIGADKILPYFNIPEEENPLLGLRAIRLSMEYMDLFADQIKAILLSIRKGYKFRILLPMVSNVWEVETARQMIENISVEIGLSKPDIPSLGIMMEVPALVYQLEDYIDLIDFVSIGTNDLIQYLLAVDRNSNVVGHLYSSFHPAVVRMLKEINDKIEGIDKELSVCGEMAGSPSGALLLLALGYRNLSVSPAKAPVLRYLSSKVGISMLENLRHNLINQNKESEIERCIYDTLEKIDPILLEIE